VNSMVSVPSRITAAALAPSVRFGTYVAAMSAMSRELATRSSVAMFIGRVGADGFRSKRGDRTRTSTVEE
jgi:hypothetical protein